VTGVVQFTDPMEEQIDDQHEEPEFIVPEDEDDITLRIPRYLKVACLEQQHILTRHCVQKSACT
jgi:hypothetical protein